MNHDLGFKSSWKEECGVFGVWNHPDSARLTFLGLYAMQHRGQESAGITVSQGRQFQTKKGLGLVGDVFKEEDLVKLAGKCAIGHVRYSTTGDNQILNAQPLFANLYNGPVAIAHNGNLVNASQLKRELQKHGAIFQGTTDTEIMLHLVSRFENNNLSECLKEACRLIKGAYSFVVMAHDRLIAIRDPLGFRPLVLGKIDGCYVVASETCVFDLIGAELVREVLPGEVIEINDQGMTSSFLTERNQGRKSAQCIFEHVYFARPDSVVFGKSVYESRKKLGMWLAKETAIEADLVIPVPDSGIPAAIGYSQASGIPFELGIIRNHYVGRTFIQPTQAIRDFGVRIKLNPQSEVLKGKRVILVDDSLVRGTTSKKIIGLVRQAGAKEVHMRIASPPTTGPCYYGVDTPEKSHLIAATNAFHEIQDFIDADSLGYLSIDGLFSALESQKAMAEKTFCAACFDGDYPIEISESVKSEQRDLISL